ncbi:MAG: Nif3-like dinuclear metal center hexameric protein [Chitinophagaceae bacterium]|nr:MAG: Nif3-like dinuclear metal center hexameric protein [Chitinophagaceae bacterium]
MTVKDISQILESFAPLAYQESYDNCGLQVGDPVMEVTGVLVTLDVTEAVLDEAVKGNCNMVVAHHPVIFSGLKKLAGRNYTERVVMKAIKLDIAIYACHTNLDNMRYGVNARIVEKLGLQNTAILSMKMDTLCKLYTFAPKEAADKVRDALFAAGAGDIGKYRECSFNTQGTGTFRADPDAKPVIGKAGGDRERVDEVKIEVLVQKHKEVGVMRALFESHPYEEVAFEFVNLSNPNQEIGAGLVGTLKHPMDEQTFLRMVKDQMQAGCVRHTSLRNKDISRVAVCGGSGSFLLSDAIAAGADAFVTADFKYHQFFDADDRIVIADIGHYESEQFTKELLRDILKKKIPNFAILLSNTSTNPVKYFC